MSFKVGDKVLCYDRSGIYKMSDWEEGIVTKICHDDYYIKLPSKFVSFFFESPEVKPLTKETTMITHVQSNSTVTIFEDDGTPHTISSDHTNFRTVKEGLVNGTHSVDDLVELMSPVKSIMKWGHGKFTCDGKSVFYDGKVLHGSLVNRILQMIAEGHDCTPLQNFMINLYNNPSFRSVDQLYGFLDNNSMGITEDGCFLAYRVVTSDYKDKYTGTVDNSPGRSPKMQRNLVDDDPNRTCSYGYHVCSLEYAKDFFHDNNRLVSVKVNPSNVVSVPVDYNNSKMRVCGYTVLADITDKVDFSSEKDYLAGRSVWSDFGPYEDNYYDEDDYEEDGFDWDDYEDQDN